jgi:hypothetical protein
VGFLNKRQEDDEELPGSGLHVDLGVRVCPECRKEALPWQEVCADCGVAPVAPGPLPASRKIHVPGRVQPGIRVAKREIDQELDAIQRELNAIAAYEQAKGGKPGRAAKRAPAKRPAKRAAPRARRGEKRQAVLDVVQQHPEAVALLDPDDLLFGES